MAYFTGSFFPTYPLVSGVCPPLAPYLVSGFHQHWSQDPNGHRAPFSASPALEQGTWNFTPGPSRLGSSYTQVVCIAILPCSDFLFKCECNDFILSVIKFT